MAKQKEISQFLGFLNLSQRKLMESLQVEHRGHIWFEFIDHGSGQIRATVFAFTQPNIDWVIFLYKQFEGRCQQLTKNYYAAHGVHAVDETDTIVNFDPNRLTWPAHHRVQ